VYGSPLVKYGLSWIADLQDAGSKMQDAGCTYFQPVRPLGLVIMRRDFISFRGLNVEASESSPARIRSFSKKGIKWVR